MDDTNNPKVSFIPKGSLVREESFLQQRRPQSAIGFLAVVVFLASVGSYVWLRFYEASLTKEVGTKTEEIKKVQKQFSDAPEVRKAKIFRARADLARELLASHVVVSPILAFLSKNTVETIFYDRFSFSQDATGQKLEVAGEAINYAALAYQADTLRLNVKELSGFSIKDISLTSFGTVTFNLSLTFVPGYLSYEKRIATLNINVPQSTGNVSVPIATPSSGVPTEALPSLNTGTVVTSPATSTVFVPFENTGSPVFVATSSPTAPQAVQAEVTPTSFIDSLWVRFKFW